MLLIVPIGLHGCHRQTRPGREDPAPPETDVTESASWCEVHELFDRECLACHSAAGRIGGLDLETDPYAALVGVESTSFGSVLVNPGDPDGSLLVRKLEGTQPITSGSSMPPTGLLAEASVVRAWVAAGAMDGCESDPGTETATDTGAAPAPYHPPDWVLPEVHGMATKLQTEEDCRTCHGADLGGGTSGVGCADCHGAAWASDCTFCHGGVETAGGAPPEDIDDNADPSLSPYRPHTQHVAGPRHSPFACSQCHREPADALAPGHLFDDDTPGVAEVDFSAGLSPMASWSAGTCSNLYCHGDGQGDDGTMVHTNPTPSCSGCHPDIDSTADEWEPMSGRHKKHLRHDLLCTECHGATVDAAQNIIDPALHVNGRPDLQLVPTMAFSAGTCDGECHGERHSGRSWY